MTAGVAIGLAGAVAVVIVAAGFCACAAGVLALVLVLIADAGAGAGADAGAGVEDSSLILFGSGCALSRCFDVHAICFAISELGLCFMFYELRYWCVVRLAWSCGV